jgi:hypothetical protein
MVLPMEIMEYNINERKSAGSRKASALFLSSVWFKIDIKIYYDLSSMHCLVFLIMV